MKKQPEALVIIHGSWQASEGWETVANFLIEMGFPVFLLDLPGHGINAKTKFSVINLHTYVNFVCQQVQEIQKQLPVVLIGHSMAGMVISQVAQNMSIQQLIYVAAFLPVSGDSLIDLAKHSPNIGISKNMVTDRTRKSITLDKTNLDKLFYNGCHPEVMEVALSRLQEEPLLPFYGNVRLSEDKFGLIPKSYIECFQDFSISLELQRFMNSRWPCDIRGLDTGHSPHYSAPEQLAALIYDCVENR